jgi:hypothetical protein
VFMLDLQFARKHPQPPLSPALRVDRSGERPNRL